MGNTMTAAPNANRPERDYNRIPKELLDAILDQIESRISGVMEIHYAMGGVAKIFATAEKRYK